MAHHIVPPQTRNKDDKQKKVALHKKELNNHAVMSLLVYINVYLKTIIKTKKQLTVSPESGSSGVFLCK